MWKNGFCEQYGVISTHAAVHAGAGGVFALTLCLINPAALSIGAVAFFSVLGGSVAGMSASLTSIGLNGSKLLKKKGQIKGGKIVRRAQLAVFSSVLLPLSAVTAFNTVSENDKADSPQSYETVYKTSPQTANPARTL